MTFLFQRFTLRLVFFLFLVASTVAAATVTWDGGGGDNNWNTNTNWDTDVVPTNSDDVVFNATAINCNLNAPATVVSITFSAGYTGTFDFTSNSLSVSGNADFSSGGTITASTGTLYFSGTTAGQTFIPKAGTTFPSITITGNQTVTVSANNLAAGTVTISSGDLDISADARTLTGTALTIDGGTLTATNGALDINGDVTLSSGTLTAPNSANFTVSGGWAKTGGTFTPDASGTVVFDATAGGNNINSGGSAFTTIQFNGAGGGWTLITNNLSATTLTLTSGTLNLGTGLTHTVTTPSLAAGGTLQFNTSTLQVSGATVDFSALGTLTANTGTLTFTGTSAQTFTPKAGASFPAITQNGSGGTMVATNNLSAALVTITSGAFDISTNTRTLAATGLTVNGGTLTATNGTIDVSGVVTLTSGTLTAPNSANFTVGGNWSRAAATFTPGASGTVVFDAGAAGETVTCGGETFTNVQFNNGSGGWTLSDALSLTGTLTLTAGALNLGAGLTHPVPGLSIGGGTLEFNTSTLQVSGATVDFSSLGTLTANTGTLTFTGTSAQTFTPKAGATFPAITQNGAGGTTVATNNLSAAAVTITSGAFDISTNTRTLTATGLTINGGTLTATNGALDINGNVALSSGTLTAPNSANFTVNGGWAKTGGTFTPGASGTVVFDATAGGNNINSGGAAFTNVTFNGAGGGWTLITNNVSATTLTLTNGTLNLGAGLTHTITTPSLAAGGTLQFNTSTLQVSGATVDFSALGTLTANTGTLIFTGTSAQTFTPKNGSTHPAITYSGTASVLVATNALGTGAFTLSGTGTWDWGDEGLTHTVSSITASAAGGMDFGTSTVQVSGNVNLNSAGAITSGTGTLEFTATNPATQVFTPDAGSTHPSIAHSGTGTLQFSTNNLSARSLSQSAGALDFNGRDITLTAGNFTITNGTSTSFANLGGRTITVSSGNGSFTGQNGNLLNMDPGSGWTVSVSGTLTASYASIGNSNASGAAGTASNSSNQGGNTNWNFSAMVWDGGGADNNWSTAGNWTGNVVPGQYDEVEFNATSTKGCDLNGASTVAGIAFTAGYTGTFNFSTNTLTVTGDADFSTGGTVTAGSGGLTFTGTSAQTFTPKAGASFPAITQNGSGGTTVATNNLSAAAVTITSGAFDISTNTRTLTATALTINGGTLTATNGTLDINGNVALSSGTLTAPNSANFTVNGGWAKTGGTFTPGASGTVVFDATAGGNNINSGAAAFTNVTFNGAGGGWTLITNNLSVTTLTLTNGTLNLGAGLTHTVTTPSLAAGGTLQFGTSTLQVTGATVDFSALGTLTANTGTLAFTGTSAQTFTPKAGATFPAITQNGAGGTTVATNNLSAAAVTITSGAFDISTNTRTLTATGLTINGGTLTATNGALDINGNVALSSGTLTAPNSANFTVNGGWAKTGGTFTPGASGTVVFDATAGGNNINSGGAAFTNVTFNGAGGGWTLTTSNLATTALTLNNGTLNLGAGLTHTASTVATGGGALQFNTSTLQVSGATVNLSGLTTLTANTGTLEFTASNPTTQTITPKAAQTHPNITHTGTGTLQLSTNALTALSFSQSAGALDLNSLNITTTGDFTITNGTTAAISNLGGRTITVGGNASLTGQSGNLLNLNPGSGWIINATGTLNASFASVANSNASGSAGIPDANCVNGGGNTNWQFTMVWDNGGGDNNWNTAVNWSFNVLPTASDAVVFNATSTANCNLNVSPTVNSITFTAGYTGTFNFSTNTLYVTGNADFSTGGSITAGTGTLNFSGTAAAQTFIPKSGATFPSVTLSGTQAVTVTTNGLTAGTFTLAGTGTWNWGTGLTHVLNSIAASAAGAMDFGSSTVGISGDVNLNSAATITAGTGTLQLTGTAGAQTFTPKGGQAFPAIIYSGTQGVLIATNALTAGAFTQSGTGTWDWGDAGLTHTIASFSASAAGTMDFGTSTLNISGNANFSALGTVTAGTGTLNFSGTTVAQTFSPKSGATFPTITRTGTVDVLVSGAALVAGAMTLSGGGTWDWGDEGYTHVLSSLTASGRMDFGTSIVQVTGNVNFGSIVNVTAGTGTLEFNGTNPVTQIFTVKKNINYPNLLHSGTGTVRIVVTTGSLLEFASFTSTGGGTLDFNGENIGLTGNFTMNNGNSGSFSNLAGRTITVAGNASLNGQSGNLLNLNPGSPWTLAVTGTLNASYANINNNNTTVSTGTADPNCYNSGSNTTWYFARIWDGGGGDNNWNTAANWTADQVPATTDSVVFNATSVSSCNLNASSASLRALVFAASYSGTFNFSSNTLTVTGGADFSLGGSITPGSGTLALTGTTGTQAFMPKQDATFPNIAKSGAGTVIISLYALNAGSFSQSAGTWNWTAFTHSLTSMSVSGGSMIFGSSIVQVTTGNAALSGLAGVTPNSGSLEFTAASAATQVLTPPAAVTLPSIIHSGTGTLQLSTNNLTAVSFYQSAGVIDFNGRNLTTTGDFSITNGTASSIASLGGKTITIAGSATLNGQSGNLLNLDAAAWAINVTGALSATYATIQNSNASGSTGSASSSVDGGGNTNWTFAKVWDGGGGDNNWNTAANWSNDAVPGTSDAVQFDGTSTANCNLNVAANVKSITFTSGYTGSFDFTSNTLTVSGNANFSSGGAIVASTGGLTLSGTTGSQTLTPKSATTFPVITYTGTQSVLVSTNALTAGAFAQSGTGTWDWGDAALTHSVSSISFSAAGAMDFGTSTVQVSGNVSLNSAATITAGTGTLQFIASSPTTQVFTPKAGQTHPNIGHTGTGTLQLSTNALATLGFSQTAGGLDFNGCNITTNSSGNFTIANGTTTTLTNLGGRTITVAGNATLDGQSGNLLNLNPVSAWIINVTGSLYANYATLQNSNASGGSLGILINGTNAGGNTNWAGSRTWDGGGADNNWNTANNWTGNAVPAANDPVTFDATSTKDCNLNANVTIRSITFAAGYTGTFNFSNSTLTLNYDANFNGGEAITAGTGTLAFNGTVATQTLTAKAGQTFPGITKTNTSNLLVAGALTAGAISLPNTGGSVGAIWDWGDQGLTHSVASIAIAKGNMDFGTSTVRVSGNVNLDANGVTAGTGTLEFTATSPTTQVFTPRNGGSHPNIVHSGTGTLQLSTRNLTALSFSQSAGTLDLNGRNITTTGGFTVTNGTTTTFTNLGGRTLVIGGNASLNGQIGNLLNLDAAAWTINVTGLLNATYANIANSNAGGSSGFPDPNSANGGGNTKWYFTRVWDNGGGDNNWNTAANWTADQAPAATDSVVFNSTSIADCNLNASSASLRAVTFTSQYTGAFNFTTNTLTVTGSANFAGGQNIVAGTGTLAFTAATGTQTFIPKASTTFPAISHAAAGTVVIANTGLTAGAFSQTAGTWDWGDVGLTHSVTSMTIQGNMDFGVSTVRVTSGNTNFSAVGTITAATGTMEFTATSGTQVFLVSTGTYPAIVHSGAGTLQLSTNNLAATSFSQTAGILDFNSLNITTTGNFSITNGTSSTLVNLGGRTITVGGDASLNGQSGNLLNLNAAAWTINTTGSLDATYATIGNSNASGSPGYPVDCSDAGGNTNWRFAVTWDGGGADNNWSTAANWSYDAVPTATDAVVFNATSTKDCDLSTAASAARITFTSGYTGVFTFNSYALTLTGNADFSSGGTIVAGTGTLVISGTTANRTLTPKSGVTLPAITFSGTGSVLVSTNALTAGSFTQSGTGTWDWGDAGLTHTVSSLTISAAGTMDFGTSTVQLSGNANFNSAGTITAGTGTLKFTAASPTTQVFTPKAAQTHPNISHTGTGTLQLSTNALSTLSFSQTTGGLDFNGVNITTVSSGSFTISNGTSSTFTGLAGRTITIAGNGSFTGQSGSYLNMNTASNHTINATGTLEATYATLGNSQATGSTGFAGTCANAGGNSNWSFSIVWDGGGADNNWSTLANWNPNRLPTSNEPVTFDNTSSKNCVLNQHVTIGSIAFSSGYTGSFNFGTCTLTVSASSNFTSGGDMLPSSGFLKCQGTNTYSITPPANDTLPPVIKTGTGTVSIATNPLISSGQFRLDAGTWDWGDNGLTHIVPTLLVNGGTMDFGTSTVKVSGSSIDLSPATALTPATGTLEFTGSGTQVFKPKSGATCPAIKHTGSGTLQLSTSSLSATSFTQTAGILDFNTFNITTTGDFSISNGSSTTFSNLAGRTITAGGNASLNGQAGDSLNMNPSSTWYLNVTGALTATYAVIQYSNASGGSAGNATFCRDVAYNTNWNFSAGTQPTPAWSRNDLSDVNGGAISDTKIFIGAGPTLRGVLLSNGSDDWSYSTASYGDCGVPVYIYSGSAYKVIAAAGNYVVGRQDGSGTTTQLFAPVNLGAATGTPYTSPDDSSFYVVYGSSLAKRKMSDGSALWTQTVTNASKDADLVVFNDYVFVATTSGLVYKYDSDGTQGPSYNTGTSINLPLLVQNSTLYVTPNTDKLYAVNTANMTAKWSGPVTLGGTNSGAAFQLGGIGGDNLIYLAAGTKAHKITDNGSSGTVNWTFEASVTILSGPIPYGNAVYFGRNSSRYYAVNVADGTLVGDWPYLSASGNATSGPWIDVTNLKVLFSTDAGNLHSFNLE